MVVRELETTVNRTFRLGDKTCNFVVASIPFLFPFAGHPKPPGDNRNQQNESSTCPHHHPQVVARRAGILTSSRCIQRLTSRWRVRSSRTVAIGRAKQRRHSVDVGTIRSSRTRITRLQPEVRPVITKPAWSACATSGRWVKIAFLAGRAGRRFPGAVVATGTRITFRTRILF